GGLPVGAPADAPAEFLPLLTTAQGQGTPAVAAEDDGPRVGGVAFLPCLAAGVFAGHPLATGRVLAGGWRKSDAGPIVGFVPRVRVGLLAGFPADNAHDRRIVGTQGIGRPQRGRPSRQKHAAFRSRTSWCSKPRRRWPDS